MRLSEVNDGGCLPSSILFTISGDKKARRVTLDTCDDDNFSRMLLYLDLGVLLAHYSHFTMPGNIISLRRRFVA